MTWLDLISHCIIGLKSVDAAMFHNHGVGAGRGVVQNMWCSLINIVRQNNISRQSNLKLLASLVLLL